MEIDYQNFKKRFDEDGYFILKSFVKKKSGKRCAGTAF